MFSEFKISRFNSFGGFESAIYTYCEADQLGINKAFEVKNIENEMIFGFINPLIRDHI